MLFSMLFDPTRTIDVVLLAILLKLIEQRDFILSKMDTDILSVLNRMYVSFGYRTNK